MNDELFTSNLPGLFISRGMNPAILPPLDFPGGLDYTDSSYNADPFGSVRLPLLTAGCNCLKGQFASLSPCAGDVT